MFHVFLTRKAERDLRALPGSELSGIIEAINSLKSSYYPEHHDVKKLKGLENYYRIRKGNWRILYIVDFDTKAIYVNRILPRKSAYKRK